MTTRLLPAAALAAVCLMLGEGGARAQPAKAPCTTSFATSSDLGAFASADIRDGQLNRLYVEMGPSRSPMRTTGAGVSGDYKASTPDLVIWTYMSIYQPAKEWLTPGSVRLDYSGFRIGWPEFRSGGKVIKQLKLTVTQGDQSMTLDIGPDASGGVVSDRVVAIDYEAMLAGRYPTVRVEDHKAWRRASDANRPIAVTLTDPSNGKIIAQGEAPLLAGETLQPLLNGSLNGMRDAFKGGACS